MPLLRRQPFIREQPPANIKPNEEVFFCKLTNEVFTDYEKFFERTILCNSLVWTCAYTGHPGLTFQEALDSEQKAEEQLAVFPELLKRPLLLVATLTHRSRLNDMNDDVFLFAKDRYFIGESVEVLIGNEKKTATVTEVFVNQKNGSTESKSVESEKRKSFSSTDPSVLQYSVQLVDGKSVCGLDSCKVGRKRHSLTRERCKLFLKKHCYADNSGVWFVKPKYHRQFQLKDAGFQSVCGGDAPTFVTSKGKKKPTARPASDSEDEDCNGDLSSDDGGESKAKEPTSLKKQKKSQEKQPGITSKVEQKTKKTKAEKERLKNIENELAELKKRAEEKVHSKEKAREEKLAAKQAKKDELKKKAVEEREKRKLEKMKIQEEKRQHEVFMKEWNKVREDMECEDLKELPSATPVNSCIPSEAFGLALYILEFITNFKSVFDFDLSSDLSLDTFSQAVASNEVDGLYFEVLKELMSAVFRHQEDEELNEDDDDDDKLKEVAEIKETATSKSSREIVRLATICAQWPVLNFATPLRKIQLDSYTISEVIRMHLLGSGCERTPNCARFDYQQRGGYSSFDDPALDFRRTEMHVLKQLSERNIFDFSPAEKVKILAVLVNQLMTFAVFRDHIEECAEKLKQVQRDLRVHQTKESRRERDEVQYWWKKKMEERLKSGSEESHAVNGTSENLNNESTLPMEIEDCVPKQKLKARSKSRQKKQEICELDFESMPVENIDWEKITADERLQMKEWAKKKEEELCDEMSELEFCCNMTAIGRDRTFRRYWVFRSTPGLFVEDDERHIPDDFLQPVVKKSESPVKQEQINGSLKCEDQGSSVETTQKVVDDSTVPDDSEHNKDLVKSEPVLSADNEVVARETVRWSMFVSQNDIDQLIEALNPRGLRESKLKQVISEQRDLILELIAQCKVSALCDSGVKSSLPLDTEKSLAEKRVEENLRDSLLDLEDRIFAGNLGSFKLGSRIDWRSAIMNFGYNSQCDTLTYGGGQTLAVQPISSNTSADSSGPVKVSGVGALKTEISNSAVRDLSMALLQIEQMIEAKYLNPPLGEDEETKKQKQKALIEAAFKTNQKSKNDSIATENGDGDKSDDDNVSLDSSTIDNSSRSGRQRTPIERWEESLLSSTSFSQVYVHLTVLDMSIVWSRSSLHARCRICRRKGDGEHMLLCDACDRGHHMYCLRPPMKDVPEGDWFCPSCRPKEVVHVPRTPRKSFKVSSSDDESEMNETDEDNPSDEDASEAENNGTVTDTEVLGNTTEDDVSTISRSTKASTRKSANASDYKTPSRGADRESENGSLGRGQRSKVQLSRAIQNGTERSRRSVDVTSKRANTKPGARLSLDLAQKRKSSVEWDKYEVDAKRLCLSTKSRSGEVEQELKIAHDLVNELTLVDDAWPFLRPVTKKEAADYFDIIKHPMDFSTIRNKFNRFEYNDVAEVLHDVRLIFTNCLTYNLPSSIVAMAGKQLEQQFERRVRQLKLSGAKRNSIAGVNETVEKPATQRPYNRKRTL